MGIKAVIFDLDGTLLDSIGDIADSVNTVLTEKGFATHSLEKYKYFVGDGIELLAKRVLPEDKHDNVFIEGFVKSIKAEYASRWNNCTSPYDGIPELLSKLQGMYSLSILSNKPHRFTLQMVESFFSEWKFDIIMGAGEPFCRKPDPAAALHIAESLNLKPQECVFVGDTDTDMQTAVSSHMMGVGVLWGFRDADELLQHGAKVLIEQPLDLINVLNCAQNSGSE